jgi:hypothetical protein
VKVASAAGLADTAADAAEVADVLVGEAELDGDRLAQEPLEGHLRAVLGQQVEAKLEEAGDRLVAGEADQEQGIFAQGGLNPQGT